MGFIGVLIIIALGVLVTIITLMVRDEPPAFEPYEREKAENFESPN